MKRITPDNIYRELPCSVVAIGSALGIVQKSDLDVLFSSELHSDGYLSLKGMDALIRQKTQVKRRENYKRGQRPASSMQWSMSIAVISSKMPMPMPSKPAAAACAVAIGANVLRSLDFALYCGLFGLYGTFVVLPFTSSYFHRQNKPRCCACFGRLLVFVFMVNTSFHCSFLIQCRNRDYSLTCPQGVMLSGLSPVGFFLHQYLVVVYPFNFVHTRAGHQAPARHIKPIRLIKPIAFCPNAEKP